MKASIAPDDSLQSGTLSDLEATMALGRRLGAMLPWPSCVALSGELGAGKTSLCRGIAAGAGLTTLDDVTSPTYALVHEYDTPRGLLIHIDAYRLEQPASAYALGLEEVLMRPHALIVVEWPERIPALLPSQKISLKLIYAEDGGRHYTLEAPPSVLSLLQ